MIDSETLILRINVDDYFFPYIKNDYNVHKSMESKWDHLFILISNKCKLKFQGYGSGWIHYVKSIKKVIIFDYGWNSAITEYIKRINPYCSIHVFFFNKISNPTHFSILKDGNVDKIWTFDSSDAIKYGISVSSIMYSSSAVNVCVTNKIASDIVFVGGAKNREGIVRKVQEACVNQDIKVDFNVIHSKEEYISYSTYLEKISMSNSILDITIEGQTGLSLRFMEALFWGKKIITNNRAIMNYPDLYKESNVFIIDDNLNQLKAFLQRDYEPYPQKVIEYYDFTNWIERFEL